MAALKLEDDTYEDYLNLDKKTDQRLEFIFGQIYMMAGASAAHQDVVLNLAYILKQWHKNNKKCLPRIAPFDLKLKKGKDINVVQPDLLLLCEEQKYPCAIFEVLSPSTAYKDKTIKKQLYELNGILEYFLVNIEQKLIDKFVLNSTTKAYDYDRAYGLGDMMMLLCLDKSIEVKDVFDGLEQNMAK